MTYGIKELRAVGVGRESSFGVVGTVTKWVPAKTANFVLGIPLEAVDETTQIRESRRTIQKVREMSGELAWDLGNSSGEGVVARSFFGTVADAIAGGAAGGTAYRHTFSVRQGANVDSMWARVCQFGTSFYDYVGLVPSKLSYKIPKDSVIDFSASFIGQNELTGTNVNGTYGTFQPFTSGANAQVQLDGTVNSDVTNISIDVENGAKTIFGIGTNNTMQSAVYGAVKVSGQFDIVFNDESQRAKFLAKTQVALKAIMTGATLFGTAKAETSIVLPKVEYSGVPFGDMDGAIGATVAFMASYDSNAYGTGAVILTVQDTLTSY